MSNPEINGGQNNYYWSAETVSAQSSVSQNLGYYQTENVNFSLPDVTQPPPNYRLPQTSVTDNKVVNYQQYSSGQVNLATQFQNGSVSSFQSSFQQINSPCVNQNYCIPSGPSSIQENQNYTYWSSNSVGVNNANRLETNWSQSVNHTTTWSTPSKANGIYSAESSRIDEKRSNRHEFSKRSDWRRERRSNSRDNSRRRSISPDSRSRSSKSRLRYDDRRDGRRDDRRERYSKYERRRRSSRERSYERRSERNSERSHRDNSYSSRSSTTNLDRSENRRKRTSKSHDSPPRPSSPTKSSSKKCLSERELILEKYRRNYCATSKDIERKMGELNAMGTEGILENERKIWTRTAPADLYYSRDEKNPKIMRATTKLNELCEIFKKLFIERAAAARALQPPYEPPARKTRARLCKHKSEACSSSSSSDSDSSLEEDDRTMEELMAKKSHPQRLHPEMWFNDPGEMNDGPLCRCSEKSRRSGIRHGIYAGEGVINKCMLDTNNADKLYHYRITISPPTNFLTKTPTIIKHDEHEFIFEGFSMLSHFPLVKLPTCKVIRFNIEYTILYIDEKLPENFTVRELDYFHEYFFKEILELMDFDLQPAQDKAGCGQFHFMPRFVRDLADNGQEILSMNEVLNYLIKNSKPLIDEKDLIETAEMPQYKWQNFADEVKGMVVTYPGKKPCSVRVDQLDRNQNEQPPGVVAYPEIVHFGIRPPQLSYAGNADYQKAWRDYVKFRHLLANMPKPSFEDKRKLEAKENKLQELRTQSKMKRDVTVDVSSEGFYRTGIMCDMVQHGMLIPVLVCHLRFHKSLDNLEKALVYKFKNRYLLQLALTHPSYRENFGTNPDHARNSLTNCGIRQPEYGDRRIHYMNTRKRGINTLINIMSRFGAKKETESSIAHNERLEFLGDAVVEFLTSIHLFHMFPDLEEGGLATYRAAIVQNQHLAVLAKKLNLDKFMLYAHGSDLCHDLELRHAMANCFEALMGALFLDGGIEIADRVFGETLFKAEKEGGAGADDEDTLTQIWVNYPKHPLQEQEPLGDRQWIERFELLQKLTLFEESIGVDFNHIRLLARAFTDRSIGYTNLTLGSNQRLEFLGDTVLQLIVSEYLYKYFPEHHEGHLSLLRSSLVNNKTQAVVCDDLGMTQYALYGNPKAELKTKDRADLLEAFLGALYVDKGLDYCQVFCDVCFFPRLQDFIMNQDWNDPKSKLQQCCLTLRTMDGGEPDIPVYKVIECKGPTNTRVYTVAVYFKKRRLAKASGHSIQEAEMNSAKRALESSEELFPQLDHQKRVIAKSMKLQQWSRNKSRGGKMAKQIERSDDSDSSHQQQKRRSRSRENRSERRSRNRYDSSDRRMKSSTRTSRSKKRSPEKLRKSPESTHRKKSEFTENYHDSTKKSSENLRKNRETSPDNLRLNKNSKSPEEMAKKLRSDHSSSPDGKQSNFSDSTDDDDNDDYDKEERRDIVKKCTKTKKRKRISEDRDFSSQEEYNIPEQYRNSNFSKYEKRTKS